MIHMSIIVLLYFILGAFAGTMSGLLGVGGGVIIVPGLAFIFRLQQLPSEFIMHLAAGTSLATIIVSTLRALYAHRRYQAKFWYIYRKLLPGVVVGVVIGACIAHYIQARSLAILFGVFLLLVAFYILLGSRINLRSHLPGPLGMWAAGLVVGGKSGLLGIGAGSVTIPFLLYCDVPMRNAMVVSMAASLTVSILGAVTLGLMGLQVKGLPPWSTGYIYWPAWVMVSAGCVLFAPWGAVLSYRVSIPVLRRVFAVFLLLVSAHLLFS